jgi:carbamoyltransferase
VRHDSRFPANAVKYCLGAAKADMDAVDLVVFYDKPLRKLRRLAGTFFSVAPRGLPPFSEALSAWLAGKMFQKEDLVERLSGFGTRDVSGRLKFSEHHLSHAASAFYPSPFAEAVVLTMDGVGEWATTSVSQGEGKDLRILRELHFPHSIGLLYSAFTYYTGFKVNSGEYKLMGLAPYGEPRFAQRILDKMVELRADGSFWLDQDYFGYCTGLHMINDRFIELFGVPPRRPDQPIEQVHMDIAASIQQVTEQAMLNLTRSLASEFGGGNLCLAGGVALNCVANGKILRDARFERLWIQPAAGDAGGAIGAAYCGWHLIAGKGRSTSPGDGMCGSYLGPAYSNEEVESRLSAAGARYVRMPYEKLIDSTAQAVAAGKAVGWFQGRMEMGPRALGARSIIADARSPAMQRLLNLKIKYRESFRPFAPSVLAEDVGEWFDLDEESPYMLLVADVLEKHRLAHTEAQESLFGIEKLNVPRSSIPAVTHVDYSARIQTVHRATNPRYHDLLSRFKALTGCPVIVNTSFNVRGEPIVCTPEEAFRCFMGTELEVLAIGDCLLAKAAQNPALKVDYRGSFSPD